MVFDGVWWSDMVPDIDAEQHEAFADLTHSASVTSFFRYFWNNVS